jgi:hypothetical protein
MDFDHIDAQFDELLQAIHDLNKHQRPQRFHRVLVTQQRADNIVNPHPAFYFVDQSNGHVYAKPPANIMHPNYTNPYLDVKPAQLTTANLSEHTVTTL